jgi:NADH:ubiquinone reductase (H+-translocating)
MVATEVKRAETSREIKQKGTETTKGRRVIVVGAGFAGLNAARELAGTDMSVLVLDRNNYHGFWPLLYQVATAGIESEAVAYPVRAIFRGKSNVRFKMAEVTSIDLERRVVHSSAGSFAYDYLVLAAGSANNYFGNDKLAEETFGLKDLDDAERLRNHLLLHYERATNEHDPEKRKALMTAVIIGGGPTGVELAGAFAELIRYVLRKDYPMLDVGQARVILVEASDRVLSTFPEDLGKTAQRKLEQLGVEVRLNSPVETVEEGKVTFKGGDTVEGCTVVWAAGVRAAHLADNVGAPLAKGSRVKVEPALNLKEHPEVFVIGDMAYAETYKEGEAYPMVAQVAIQQGKHTAHSILRAHNGEEPEPFKYFDLGYMATIGRRAAVMDAFGLHLSGRLAWLGWLVVHIIYLIGFRNRLIVITNWAYNYFTYERGVRLITNRHNKQ